MASSLMPRLLLSIFHSLTPSMIFNIRILLWGFPLTRIVLFFPCSELSYRHSTLLLSNLALTSSTSFIFPPRMLKEVAPPRLPRRLATLQCAPLIVDEPCFRPSWSRFLPRIQSDRKRLFRMYAHLHRQLLLSPIRRTYRQTPGTYEEGDHPASPRDL